MVTRTVTEPLQVMKPLVDFRPDLILIDIHMPDVTGTEIAAILRQESAYVSIPIVFLSSEKNPDKQQNAMLLGADDFLTKPVEPGHLISSVTSRVQRARTLRNLAERDSLTGLLNHTRFKEQLSIEVARAQRMGTSLAFVMLDIDHFKTINDTYGHPTGDRVLKSFALLFKQRLRKTDVLGRYGGEEFGVIMPDTGEGAAFQVMEELREAFAKIGHSSHGTIFQVTFSGGIATLPPWQDAASLNEAADRALYHAKRGGRNQVVYAVQE
jgi:diguanylate cyclase (GGDEF)-like protein